MLPVSVFGPLVVGSAVASLAVVGDDDVAEVECGLWQAGPNLKHTNDNKN